MSQPYLAPIFNRKKRPRSVMMTFPEAVSNQDNQHGQASTKKATLLNQTRPPLNQARPIINTHQQHNGLHSNNRLNTNQLPPPDSSLTCYKTKYPNLPATITTPSATNINNGVERMITDQNKTFNKNYYSSSREPNKLVGKMLHPDNQNIPARGDGETLSEKNRVGKRNQGQMRGNRDSGWNKESRCSKEGKMKASELGRAQQPAAIDESMSMTTKYNPGQLHTRKTGRQLQSVDKTMRLLTASLADIKRCVLKNQAAIPILFETYGTMDSAMSSSRGSGCVFVIKDDSHRLTCVFHEIDRQLDRLVMGVVYRCVGGYDDRKDRLVCVSVRRAVDGETKLGQTMYDLIDTVLDLSLASRET